MDEQTAEMIQHFLAHALAINETSSFGMILCALIGCDEVGPAEIMLLQAAFPLDMAMIQAMMEDWAHYQEAKKN